MSQSRKPISSHPAVKWWTRGKSNPRPYESTPIIYTLIQILSTAGEVYPFFTACSELLCPGAFPFPASPVKQAYPLSLNLMRMLWNLRRFSDVPLLGSSKHRSLTVSSQEPEEAANRLANGVSFFFLQGSFNEANLRPRRVAWFRHQKSNPVVPI